MQLKVRNKNVAELIDKFVGDGVGIDSMMLRFRNSVIVRALTLTEGKPDGDSPRHAIPYR
jgi:hypothetical protein